MLRVWIFYFIISVFVELRLLTLTYGKAKEQLQLLEEAHKEHTEITADLSRDLECISEELDQMKKRTDDRASSVTDSSALVEIRKATERLRNENKELDIHIGILVSRE